MANSNLNVRVTALEEEFTAFKQSTVKDKSNWTDKIFGSFENDPDFDAAMELGRKYREALRPKLPGTKAKGRVKKQGPALGPPLWNRVRRSAPTTTTIHRLHGRV